MQLFTPKQYLKIDVANSFGLDKLTWDQRLEWFDAHESVLLSKLSEAESPAMYYAGCKAWEDAKAGRASGYPISLDATASGMQILSVLTGDKQAALLTNVIENPAKKRSDAYTALYESMLQRTGGQVAFHRNDLKRAIMTAFYGSKEVPKNIFGEGKMLEVFFRTLEEETPFIWELNKAFLDMWDPTVLKHSWVLPDNFHVNVKIMGHVQENVQFAGETIETYRKQNMPQDTGRSIGANITHSLDGFIIRELLRRCAFKRELKTRIQNLINEGPSTTPTDAYSENDKMVMQLWELYERSGYLSARILDHLEPSNLHLVNTDPLQDLLDSMPDKPFQIVPVHDCFRVHPNYGNDLRRQYNQQLHLIAKSNMLSYLVSQVLNRHIPVTKQADFSSEILNANYALS